jgi:hypothetical protein
MQHQFHPKAGVAQMKKLIAVLFAVSVLVPSVSNAGQVRASAILTSSDVISTFTLPRTGDATYYDVYCDFTKGSLDSCTIAPCACYIATPAVTASGVTNGGPAATSYYKPAVSNTVTSYTMTATGSYRFRIPADQFGDYTYRGIFSIGTGTATSSHLTIYVPNTPTAR